MMSKSQKLVVGIILIIAVLVLARLSLPFWGSNLVADDKPQKSDIIIVLMGSGPDRMLGAADFYKHGYADEIIMVRNMIRGYDLVANEGIKIPHDTETAKNVAIGLGVPAERVIILPGDAQSTQDEALYLREYMKEKEDIHSLIIVTSKPHSGRAKKIFVKAMKYMDREVKIISCPTPYDDFDARGWWQNREDLKRGVLEYLKLAHFYIRDQFRL